MKKFLKVTAFIFSAALLVGFTACSVVADPTPVENPDTPGNPSEPKEPEIPSDPDDPEIPETPDEPETPVTPSNPSEPEEPEVPADPATPTEPETPVEPTEPTEPEIPDEPEVTYIGTKAPSESKAVGDIVFNDGSATPYTDELTLTDEQKEAAIAIIFYTGTGLNSGSDTTSRTLGVGLTHSQTGLAWCTKKANAYKVDITTIESGDKNGSDNLEQIATFLKANGSTDDTADADKYPAFYFAKNYSSQEGSRVNGTSYADGWYFPSYAELDQLYKNGNGTDKAFDIDAAIELCGGDKFGTKVYWSSSQYASKYGNDLARRVSSSYGWTTNSKSSDANYVCAVRAFN